MTSSRALTTHAPVRPNATRSCRKPRFIVHDDQEHTGRPPRQRQRGGPRRLAPRWPPIRHQPAPPYGGPTLSVASDPLGRRAHQRVDRTGSSNSMRNGRSDGRPPQHARGAPLGVGSHTALTRSLDERLTGAGIPPSRGRGLGRVQARSGAYSTDRCPGTARTWPVCRPRVRQRRHLWSPWHRPATTAPGPIATPGSTVAFRTDPRASHHSHKARRDRASAPFARSELIDSRHDRNSMSDHDIVSRSPDPSSSK